MARSSTPETASDHDCLPLWARASVVYLFLPLFPFAAGWLKPWISIPLILMAAASCWKMMRGGNGRGTPDIRGQDMRHGAAILAIAVCFAFLTGFWEGMPQSTDQPKHNLILADLIERDWPVRYPGGDGGEYLCYGLGYYMVPSAIAKVFGMASVGSATFIWAALGLFLFFLGLGRTFRNYPMLGIAGFLFASGLGGFWYLVKTGFLHQITSSGGIPTDHAAYFLKLGLFTTNLDPVTRMFYQPQHGIAGWLGGLLLHEMVIVRKRWTEASLVLAAAFFWSPLTTAGLGVILLPALAVKPRTLVIRPVIHLMTAFAVISILMAYYIPHVPIADKGFIWEMVDDHSWMVWYGLFVICFVLLQSAAIFWLDWKQPYLGTSKHVVLVMSLLLLVCPLFKLGYFNDLRMQVSGPAFLFIAMGMTRGLLQFPSKETLAPYLFLCGVFLAGAMFPAVRAFDNMTAARQSDHHIANLRKNGFESIKDLRMPGFDVTVQYLGKSGAATARWILKEPGQQ